MNDFYIERLNQENFSKFYRLFGEIFGTQTSYDFLLKKYDTRYLGAHLQYIGFLAFNAQGEAVSYCGVLPFAFRIDGKRYIGAHSCDHMTRTDARKKGVFVELNNRTDELCTQLGVAFVFGFPNQNNHPILVKYAQWVIIDTMQVFEIAVATAPFAAVANRVSWLESSYKRYSDSQLSAYLTEELLRREGNGIIRDRAFYRYKKYSANVVVQLENGKVWLKIKGALFIGDIELAPTGDFSILLTEIRRLAVRLGVRKIVFLSSTKLALTQQFSKHFAPKTGNAVGVKLLQPNLNLNLNQLQFTLGDYDTF